MPPSRSIDELEKQLDAEADKLLETSWPRMKNDEQIRKWTQLVFAAGAQYGATETSKLVREKLGMS